SAVLGGAASDRELESEEIAEASSKGTGGEDEEPEEDVGSLAGGDIGSSGSGAGAGPGGGTTARARSPLDIHVVGPARLRVAASEAIHRLAPRLERCQPADAVARREIDGVGENG